MIVAYVKSHYFPDFVEYILLLVLRNEKNILWHVLMKVLMFHNP